MMMNDHGMLSDQDLEGLFEAARDEAPLPSQELWQQVLHDAQTQQPALQGMPVSRPVRKGLLGGLLAAIGGWPSFAGLATAVITGVWIGFSDPAGLSESRVAVLLPGYDNGQDIFELEDFEPGLVEFAELLEEG